MLTDADYKNWTACLQNLDIAKNDLQLWVSEDLRQFFPFEKAILALGNAVAGEIRVDFLLSVNHAPDYLEHLSKSFNVVTRSSFAHWMHTREPFVIQNINDQALANQFELDEMHRFKLANVAAHGVLSLEANSGTYCSFSGVPNTEDAWLKAALRLMAPVLHDLAVNHFATINAPTKNAERNLLAKLSPHQLIIARHVSDGFVNKEIAKKLSISEKTVRNQLSMIYSQLGIRQRTQLIGICRG
jgi:DNA-binding CsgD family transcriptional regulator